MYGTMSLKKKILGVWLHCSFLDRCQYCKN